VLNFAIRPVYHTASTGRRRSIIASCCSASPVHRCLFYICFLKSINKYSLLMLYLVFKKINIRWYSGCESYNLAFYCFSFVSYNCWAWPFSSLPESLLSWYLILNLYGALSMLTVNRLAFHKAKNTTQKFFWESNINITWTQHFCRVLFRLNLHLLLRPFVIRSPLFKLIPDLVYDGASERL
jgi:hypothetical protein